MIWYDTWWYEAKGVSVLNWKCGEDILGIFYFIRNEAYALDRVLLDLVGFDDGMIGGYFDMVD